MGTNTSALQVGILVVIASLIFVGGYVFFKHDQIANSSYMVTIEFADAEGVAKGSDVEFSGVPIGEVEDIQLARNGAALVRARIHQDVKIPTDASVTIVSSLLGSQSKVEILPPKTPAPEAKRSYYAADATITGAQGLSFATLQTQAGGLIDALKVTTVKTNKLLDQLTITAKSANDVISDPSMRNSLNGTIANINEASVQALHMATDLHEMVSQDNRILKESLNNVDSSTRDLVSLTHNNRAKLNSMIANLDASSVQVNELVTHANKLLNSTSDALDKGGAVQNLTATLANLKTATDKLNAIEDDVRSITGDKTVQSNLRTTASNVAQASGQTNELIGRLNSLAGGHAKRTLPFSSQLVLWEQLRQPRFRTDFDVYFPYGNQYFVRAGVFDLTETNGLNFQLGQRYNDRVSARVGVYDSKVGAGVDFAEDGSKGNSDGGGGLFTADLYNPNNLTLDLRQRFRVGNGTALWLGMEDIPKDPTVSVGLELNH